MRREFKTTAPVGNVKPVTSIVQTLVLKAVAAQLGIDRHPVRLAKRQNDKTLRRRSR